MESSFSKGYDKNILPDGTIELSYKALRFGTHSGFAAVAAIALLPASCAVTSPILISADAAQTSRDSGVSGPITIWLICALALYSICIWILMRTSGSLQIKPGKGLIFFGNQLPFGDIQVIGTQNQTTAQNAKGTAYVFANSHGRQIKLTKYIPLERAEAIAEEVRQSSGSSWG